MKEPGRILVIGSANADYVIHSKKVPALGETLTGTDFAVNPGGKGLNQAVAISKLGGNTVFIGAVGNDMNGKLLCDVLTECNIPFHGFTLNSTTGIAMITVVNGDNFILLHEGANRELTPERIQSISDEIRRAEYLVMQLEIPIESVQLACRIAQAAGTKIVLNPAPFKKFPEALLVGIDYLIPNEHEAKDLLGYFPDSQENSISAVRALRGMGAKNVIITLGERGCVYNDGEDICFAPAVPVNAVDTTSAGDSFIGALVTQLSHGKSITDAIHFASRVAAVTVSRPGAAQSIPSIHELEV